MSKDIFQKQEQKETTLEVKAQEIQNKFPDLYVDSDSYAVFINGSVSELEEVRNIFGGSINKPNEILIIDI